MPDSTVQPVPGHALCQLTENMFQLLELATHRRSTQLTRPACGTQSRFFKILTVTRVCTRISICQVQSDKHLQVQKVSRSETNEASTFHPTPEPHPTTA